MKWFLRSCSLLLVVLFVACLFNSVACATSAAEAKPKIPIVDENDKISDFWITPFIPFVLLLIYLVVIIFMIVSRFKNKKAKENYKNKYYPVNNYYPGTRYDKCYNHLRYRNHDN